MKLPNYLTTVTPFSKALAMGLFIVLPFIGFWLGTQIQVNNKIDTIQLTESIPDSTLPTQPQEKNVPANTSNIKTQKFDELIWKKYSNDSFGLSFEYPDNLPHFGESQLSALRIDNNEITLHLGMSYIFQIRKHITNDTPESWWDKNDASKNEGNGRLPAKMMKTMFHNKVAYYFETLATQQNPSDFYIVPFNGFLLEISFSKVTPYRDALWACINVKPNSCTKSDLSSIIDNDNSYRQFQDLIIQRILSSISFSL